MAKKTIRFASFKYTDKDGVHRVAFRGDTVNLPDSEVERGERVGAFGDPNAAPAGELDVLTADSTDEEFDAWVATAKNKEIEDFLRTDEGNPLAERILESEGRVAAAQQKDVRAGVEKAVKAAVDARSA